MMRPLTPKTVPRD